MNPYIPDLLPPEPLKIGKFIKLIGNSRAELARYDGILQGLPNPGLLLSPLITHEAVESSKIEGTYTTMEEVLSFEAAPSRKNPKFDDIEEVLNYRKALLYASETLRERNFSLFTLREIHSILLDGVRGQDKARGNFRNKQVFIGARGQSIEQARFIPPEPLAVPALMENLVEYYLSDDEIDCLIQLAVIHAQFEIIHPFEDGNGRIGRMLVPLFLFEKKQLFSPTFYISAFFEKNRDEYTGRLNRITSANDWEGWIAFFLNAVTQQAKDNNRKAKLILELYNDKKERILKATDSKHTIKILDALFHKPAFTSAEFARLTQMPRATIARILESLEKEAIIKTIRPSSGRQPALMIFPKLIAITDS
ncbi:MAG: Fic family protein [Firmicutes bacterium]|nr:Fic family protein [Bacillota bacterium]